MMPIDTKPEEKIIYGAELEAAVTDGIQRAIGRRVSNLRVTFNGVVSESRGLDAVSITVDVVGSLKGPKPGAKRKPRAKPATPAT
jgi:hypothetical protein